MGKRSSFERIERDFYPTPYKAVPPLIPHLRGVIKFAEPCCGNGALIRHLERHGLRCVHRRGHPPGHVPQGVRVPLQRAIDNASEPPNLARDRSDRISRTIA